MRQTDLITRGLGLLAGLALASPLSALTAALADHARPLHAPADLDPLLPALGAARVALLGEATHGTHEFYAWRAAITRRLVADHGFRVIAVEGDWAPLLRLNAYTKGHPDAGPSARAVLAGLNRWPQWMWGNEEIAELAEWLRAWNADRPEADQVGFYGIDAYAPWDSANLVLDYLRAHRPDAWAAAHRAYVPLLNPRQPERAFMQGAAWMNDRERAAVAAVAEDLREPPADGSPGTTGWFAAWQAAKVVLRAKTHFHTSGQPGPESWNVRARHMHESVLRLLDARGPDARAVVWAHNTHIGDARATAMGAQGMVNIGQLAREHFGADQVFALGFATHHGEVVAGRAWGGRRAIMTIPPAPADTLEGQLAAADAGDRWWDLREPALAEHPALRPPLPHRAIGVVYQPEHDATRNFVPTVLPARYDALLFIARTTPLRPLD
jgi:erythromycin esterase